MRKTIKIIGVVLFLSVVSYVGWIIFSRASDRSRKEANENNAVRTLKKIHQAQINVKAKSGKYLSLEELANENAISSEIKSGKVSGYNFSVKSEGEKYSALASRNQGEGNLSFYVDETGVIRASDKLIAGPNDQPSRLQNLIE